MGATRQHDYDAVCVEYRNRTRRLEALLNRVLDEDSPNPLPPGLILDIARELSQSARKDVTT